MKRYLVRVIPRSSQNRVEMITSQELKVRLNAPPVDGKANEMLLELIANYFGIKKREVRIVSGQSSRTKWIELLSFLLLFLLFPWRVGAEGYQGDRLFPAVLEDAAVVADGKIQLIIPHLQNPVGWIVFFKPDQVTTSSTSQKLDSAVLKVFYSQLFPNQKLPLVMGQRYLLILKTLPRYDLYQKFVQNGVLYELAGNKRGFFENSADFQAILDFAKGYFSLHKILPGDFNTPEKLFQYFLSQLQTTTANALKEDLPKAIFQYPQTFWTAEALQSLLKLIQSPQFPNLAKIELAKGLTSLPIEKTKNILKELFCLPPVEVCSVAVETLEKNGLSLPLEQYQAVFLKAPSELKYALLDKLGRVKQQNAIGLFEQTLRTESEEKYLISGLISLGDLGGAAAENLVLSFAKDSRFAVKVAILKSLGKLKSEKGIPILEEAIKTKNPTLIVVAAQALENIGSPLAVQTLEKYYHKGPHGHWEPSEK